MDRVKLTITSVAPEQKVGERGTRKLPFKAKDAAGEHEYSTFRTSLFPLIKVGAEVEADIETTQKVVGDTTYTNRQLSEIYQDGKAMSAKGGGGFQKRIADPEERASIESQTAFKGVIELLTSEVMLVDNPLAITAMDWANKRLRGTVESPTKETPPAAKKDVVADEFADAAREAGYNLNDPDEKGLLHAWIKDQTGGKEWIKCNAGEKRKLITAMHKKADAKKQ